MSSSPSSSSPSVEEAEEAAAAQCPSSGFIATAPAAAAPPSNSPVPSAAPPPPPSRPSCYRIEHRADAAGKRIASSKRRILFHFGTLCPRTNRPSDDGVHLVTLSWSPTSGRTVLAADGREVSLRDGRRMIFGGLQVRRFEESWILGEEGGVTSSNDYGMHLRIVARAVAPPSSSSPKRTGRAQQQQQRRRRRRRGGERQFDLFIDGRSYFDLPYLDEATGRLVYGGDLSAEDENESARGGLGLLGLGLGAVSSVSSSAEMEDDANATIEDWTADGSAISGYGDDDDDDDDNSIDGFMQSIDLGTLTPYGDDDEKSAASSSIATVAGGTRRRGGRRRRDKIVRARNELREKSARAVGRIGTSTKTAVAQTSQRLAAGTSRVLASPKALKNRGSPSGSEGESGGEGKTNGNGGDGDGNKSARNGSSSGGGGEEGRSDYSGETSNTADSKIEEHGQQQQRIAPGEYTSFQAMHRAITPPRPQREQREQEPGTPQRSRGQRQEQQQQQQKHEQTQKEAEDAAEEVIAGLRNRISRLEMEIATSDRRAAASTAKLREEAASLWETTERELSSARAQAREQRSRAEAAERECDSLRRDKGDAEEEIGRLRRHVENLERELVSATRAANDDDGTSKKKKKKKKKEGSSREKNGPPFLPNEETMSYLGEPVCCLCNRDVTESMRQCQCGRESCDLSAHASCLIGSRHHPTPSISHPGTPAPTLPLILCRGIFDNK
uniref:Uncharacterized protein n=1 Tax=Odontella aurita TaxID=265563 RepID=A0A7S4N8J5_9STRA